MLLQTNSYIVPKDRRAEHERLMRRFRQALARIGCDQYEVYEQVGPNWSSGEKTGRFVQIMRFRDRKHQLEVQSAERDDPVAQALIKEFCELINFPYQQQQGLFAVGFYQGISAGSDRPRLTDEQAEQNEPGEAVSASPAAEAEPGTEDTADHSAADAAEDSPDEPVDAERRQREHRL